MAQGTGTGTTEARRRQERDAYLLKSLHAWADNRDCGANHLHALEVAIRLVEGSSVAAYRRAVARLNQEEGRYQRKPKTGGGE